ncbi:MAG: hypothetical protein EP315_09085 [Gammaproteobacteria bacterium]|nr:MAG: hypothetical protein EP315_09085 [Gammaproteobacteria bacterium]
MSLVTAEQEAGVDRVFVLSRNDDQFLLLLGYDHKQQAFECCVPGEGLSVPSPGDFANRYCGYIIQLKLLPHIDARREAIHHSTERRWFWRVMNKSATIYRDVLLASFMINVFALASPLFIMPGRVASVDIING